MGGDRNLIKNVMETGIKMSIFEKQEREWELLHGNEWEWESITHSLFFKCKQKQRAIEPERRTTSYTTRHVNCRRTCSADKTSTHSNKENISATKEQSNLTFNPQTQFSSNLRHGYELRRDWNG